MFKDERVPELSLGRSYVAKKTAHLPKVIVSSCARYFELLCANTTNSNEQSMIILRGTKHER